MPADEAWVLRVTFLSTLPYGVSVVLMHFRDLLHGGDFEGSLPPKRPTCNRLALPRWILLHFEASDTSSARPRQIYPRPAVAGRRSAGPSGDPVDPSPLAAPVALCLRSALHEKRLRWLPAPRSVLHKSVAPCLPMHRHGRVGRFNVGPILVLFESLGSGLAATSVAPCLRSALRKIG